MKSQRRQNQSVKKSRQNRNNNQSNNQSNNQNKNRVQKTRIKINKEEKVKIEINKKTSPQIRINKQIIDKQINKPEDYKKNTKVKNAFIDREIIKE